jgi:hypothetical protein
VFLDEHRIYVGRWYLGPKVDHLRFYRRRSEVSTSQGRYQHVDLEGVESYIKITQYESLKT